MPKRVRRGALRSVLRTLAPKLFHDCAVVLGQGKGVRVEFSNNKARCSPCTFHGRSKQLSSFERVSHPSIHCAADGHVADFCESLKRAVYFRRYCNREPYLCWIRFADRGGLFGVHCTSVHHMFTLCTIFVFHGTQQRAVLFTNQ